MKKAKKIIRDLKHLKGNKIFGYYDTVNQKETKNLGMSVFGIIRALSEYEIDFRKEYRVDYDDVVYEDKEGNYDLLTISKSDNSYNWSSMVTFNFDELEVDDRKLIAVKFHRYGDVRGNYSDYMVLDMTLDNFYEVIMEASRIGVTVNYKGNRYDISTDAFKEGCCFDVYCNTTDTDLCDILLDIDNTRSLKSIKKALTQYFKENK